MRPEQILAHAPLVLDQAARERYFEQGYVLCPGYLSARWLERLRVLTQAQLELSRTVQSANEAFDLGPGHCAEQPNVRRIRATVDRDPGYWDFATDPEITDLVADLVGPDVKFHSSKLNFKRARDGDPVKWHQDIQAWPHTNFSPLTLGVYLHDTGPDQGPLSVLPGSHLGPIYEMYDGDRWTGHMKDTDLARLDLTQAVDLTGPAGTVCAIDCRVLHGSAPNHSDIDRPMLLYVYSSADAFTFTPAPTPTSHTGEIVRGKPARHAHFDDVSFRLPPDWSKVGYRSIYAAQHGEARAMAGDAAD